MKNILISGGSGMVGTALRQKLRKQGYETHTLSRNPEKVSGQKVFYWNITDQEIDPRAFEGVSHIIHLAGANIAEKRWTPERKKVIINSRVDTAKLLLKGVEQNDVKIDAFISASGINYYGTATTGKIFVETDPHSHDFIGECCAKWEAAADDFQSLARVVKLRTAVVLSPKGGALERIAQPIKCGVGAKLGSGRQYMPYIHIDDLCEIYAHAIEDDQMKGAYNASNGDHITNEQLTKTIAKVLNKPLWLPEVPAFVLKKIFGEMSRTFLGGSRVSTRKIMTTGISFKYDEIENTLFAIYR